MAKVAAGQRYEARSCDNPCLPCACRFCCKRRLRQNTLTNDQYFKSFTSLCTKCSILNLNSISSKICTAKICKWKRSILKADCSFLKCCKER
ncbi:hypothetical protein V5799_007321 [Amblyomma americanum]|uniref:Uncharacterized protein n=1 Tax=Amblyomma americanum TaxID=6943 RepID=A0AAQ4DTW8_AMBAM